MPVLCTDPYRLDGQDVAELGRDARARIRRDVIGFVFQDYHLIDGLDLLQNVELPAIHAGLSRAARRRRGTELLRELGLGDRLHSRPADLSGGEQQRVAIARALAMQPLALLCDEITSALDPELVNEVLAVVKELAQEGMTLLMVTHEMRFARDVCSRVVFMHLGRVHEIGPPGEVFANPRTPELKQFLGVH